MNASSRIYVAGHRGMVGSAICRALQAAGLPTPITFTSAELDLRDQSSVHAMMEREKPTHIFLAQQKWAASMPTTYTGPTFSTTT